AARRRSAGQVDVVRAKMARQILECRSRFGRLGTFEPEPSHPEHAFLAIQLEVGASTELPTDQERQYEIAILSLVFRHIDFDPVTKPEHALDPGALPHQVVEGRQYR